MKKDKYAFNPQTGEVHLLANVTGSCNLSEGIIKRSSYSSQKAIKDATGIKRLDRCAHCWRMKMKEAEG